ncbi:glycoside hydrolase family 36 protein [Butyrivibrio sp. INlla21]|uniref:glycoside hydrolase family 36 protein n=1 Tax=Butyrivibrio sp. INlla21 TaxID=1520811 RepID=UPI0008F19401|nr:glycoside hydrolase family 36 protein [Butyrivibrio sp. INlla21]SFU99239.1 alpha-galactosidase [Butyrivibrio sp. INlla21]
MITRKPLNDMDAIYMIDDSGQVSFTVVPAVGDELFLYKIKPDPLVQISCTGDATSIGFAAGETRHNSALTMSMKFVSQDVKETSEGKTIETIIENSYGIKARHVVIAPHACRSVRVFTEVINNSEKEITIEALSSVNISALTPYTEDEGRERLTLHRFRSRWSEEGRHEERTVEDLLLEPSWANFGVRCEKFGAIGSMPVRGYFPFAAVEDKKSGVIWALSLATPASWQIEAVRIDKGLSISAGLADFEFGHWRKTLRAGESFVSPEAYVTAARSDFDSACDRLLDIQRNKLLPGQRVYELPAIFNEYCTTWGEPSEEVIGKLLDVIKGKDFEYFLIDAGWYADSVKGWQDNMGDWNVAKDLFPNGIKRAVDMITSAGMKAGIWFELEVVGKDSDMADDSAHLLTRDGKVIVSGTRRFWDMRSSWVTSYLTGKVIDFLNDNNFKYIKIDYNDTIGIGCDGAESYGEGLRACALATLDFYKKIRESVPDIAIEVCSSGGHRLVPAFMETADYLSFSDAHEEKEIPVIAADLQKLVLAQKSQIWAVLRKDDELKRIAYSVCAGMYGVLCISGDVFDLDKEQWELALRGVDFYKKASPIIADGFTHRFGPFQNSNRDLKDYQASVRYGQNGKALVIVHSFKHEGLQKIELPLENEYEIADKYETGDHKITIAASKLMLEFEAGDSFDAVAVLLD